MKNILVVGALALLLVLGVAVYFGFDKDPQPVTETPAPASDDVEDTEAPVDEAPATDPDETQVVVEESAAEPEEDEQAIVLAHADTSDEPQNWQFQEGKHYIRMVPTQPTMGGADKIEVAEFFWYGCPHCYSFEPTINGWAADAPAGVRFVRIPVAWNQIHELHARLYYTADVLARNGELQDGAGFHEAVFEEFHRRGNKMTSEDSIQRLFERYNVSPEAFSRTWESFEVDQKLRVAKDLARRYAITGVPAVVVNGKYRTGGAEAGSYDAVIDVIDELIVRESSR